MSGSRVTNQNRSVICEAWSHYFNWKISLLCWSKTEKLVFCAELKNMWLWICVMLNGPSLCGNQSGDEGALGHCFDPVPRLFRGIAVEEFQRRFTTELQRRFTMELRRRCTMEFQRRSSRRYVFDDHGWPSWPNLRRILYVGHFLVFQRSSVCNGISEKHTRVVGPPLTLAGCMRGILLYRHGTVSLDFRNLS